MICSHPEYALHVKYVDIRIFPLKDRHVAQFLSEATKVVNLAANLIGFRCTVPSSTAVPPFLKAIQGKERLKDIRIRANLTEAQGDYLTTLTGLKNIAVEHATWNVINALPTWAVNLTSIVIYSSPLTEPTLSAVLQSLPRLKGLHVISCSSLDHTAILRQLTHVPLLEDLSLSTADHSVPIDQQLQLTRLKHLSCHTRTSVSVVNIFAALKASFCPLESLTLKVSDKSMIISPAFMEDIVASYRHTLARLSLFECNLGIPSLTMVTTSCKKLTTLEIPIPLKELGPFSKALGPSKSLRTLVDTASQPLHTHGTASEPYLAVTTETARILMKSVSQLEALSGGGRIWTRVKSWKNPQMESKTPVFDGEYWFVPRDYLLT